MKTCIIFCAGQFDTPARPIGQQDILIAADGGLRHTQALGIRPDVILGDFDSLGYAPEGAQVFPVEKDDTDSMLAIKKGLELGCDNFVIYGGLDGDRLDHTVANLQSLLYLAERGARGTLVGMRQVVQVLRSGKIDFPADFAGIVSVFCLGSDARGVTIRGLKYQLTDGALTAGFPLGVSNHFVGRPASVSVENGTLLLIWDRQNGIL